MTSQDIVLDSFKGSNFYTDITNLIDIRRSITLDLKFNKHTIANTYKLIVQIDAYLAAEYKQMTFTGIAEYIFFYPDFIPSKFYREEHDIIVQLVYSCYEMTRAMFNNEYRHIPKLGNVFLGTLLREDIKDLMAKTDVYNKL